MTFDENAHIEHKKPEIKPRKPVFKENLGDILVFKRKT